MDPDPQHWSVGTGCAVWTDIYPVLCIGIVLMLIRIRLSVLMPILIRILPHCFTHVRQSVQNFTFLQSTLFHLSRQRHRSHSIFWTICWNFLEKSIIWLYIRLKWIRMWQNDADPTGSRIHNIASTRVQISLNWTYRDKHLRWQGINFWTQESAIPSTDWISVWSCTKTSLGPERIEY